MASSRTISAEWIGHGVRCSSSAARFTLGWPKNLRASSCAKPASLVGSSNAASRSDRFMMRLSEADGPAERFDQQRVLRHREDVLPDSLPVPARDAREAMGDVFDLDVQRRGVEEIEPAPREHALPGTRRLSGHPTAAAAGRSAALAPSPIARRLPPRAWWLRQFLRRAPPR